MKAVSIFEQPHEAEKLNKEKPPEKSVRYMQ